MGSALPRIRLGRLAFPVLAFPRLEACLALVLALVSALRLVARRPEAVQLGSAVWLVPAAGRPELVAE